MKKAVCFVLAVLLCVCFAGCKKKSYSEDKTTHNPAFKIVTEKEKYGKDDEMINYTVTNISNEDITFGVGVQLSKKIDGEWKLVDYDKEVYFIEIAMILSPGEKAEKSIDLKEYYNLPLETGEYRIVLSSVAVSNLFIVE